MAVEEKEMLQDQTFQNEENERKAAIKAEREEKKKEVLKNKNLVDLPEDDLKQALKAEREIRKKAREDKKQKAFQKRLSSPYDPSLSTAATPKRQKRGKIVYNSKRPTRHYPAKNRF